MISRIVTRLEELVGDVDLTGIADGKVLAYEAASQKWKPTTVDTSIDSEDVTTALGYTPANAASVVSAFNTRTGAVTLLSADVTGALGFTPANKAGDTFSGRVVAGHTGSANPDDQRYGILANPSASILANYRPFGYKRQSDGAYPFYVDSAGYVYTSHIIQPAFGNLSLGTNGSVKWAIDASGNLSPPGLSGLDNTITVGGTAGSGNRLARVRAMILEVQDKLAHGNTAAATTLGTVTRRMPVYDAAGTLLGYVPIYDSIS